MNSRVHLARHPPQQNRSIFKPSSVLVFLQNSPRVQHIAKSVDCTGWIVWEFSVKASIIPSLPDYPANSCASTENVLSRWCWEGIYPHSEHIICIFWWYDKIESADHHLPDKFGERTLKQQMIHTFF
jgi:hypothetical protein